MIVITVQGGVVVEVVEKNDRGEIVNVLVEGEDYQLDDQDVD